MHSPLTQMIPLPLRRRSRGRIKRHLVVTTRRSQLADVIRQHQHVFSGGVLEVVINSFVLQQPTQEIKVTFTILDAVFPRLIASTQRLPLLHRSQLLADLRENVGRRLVLKYSAVSPSRKQPERRPKHRAVLVRTNSVANLCELGDDTVEVTFTSTSETQSDRQRLPQNIIGARISSQQRQLILKRPTDLLTSGQARQLESLQ